MKLLANEHLLSLKEGYLFTEISNRVARFRRENPQKRILNLGIGDVSRPISPYVAGKMADAAAALSEEGGLIGYGSVRGDASLRRALAKRYGSRGVVLSIDEIFISDGAKSDLGNLLDVFGDNISLIFEPSYPVYLDVNLMSGRRMELLGAGEESGFLQSPEGLKKGPYLIYICSPNNPTGAVFDSVLLKKWVDFALLSGSLIIFDVAYEAFISDPLLPHSIFEIEGAMDCAIEVGSFSKMAGFTGVRCGWTVIPSGISAGNGGNLNALWERRQATKFNGASCISQVGALASLSEIGARECAENVASYMKNARRIADFLRGRGFFFSGGENAPYVWLRCPSGFDSWRFFDFLLEGFGIVGTPGIGFGGVGDAYFRLSSFARDEDVDAALDLLGSTIVS